MLFGNVICERILRTQLGDIPCERILGASFGMPTGNEFGKSIQERILETKAILSGPAFIKTTTITGRSIVEEYAPVVSFERVYLLKYLVLRAKL